MATLAASTGEIDFPLPDGRTARGRIEMRILGPGGEIEGVSGSLVVPGKGRFVFQREAAPGVLWPLSGVVEFEGCQMAYRVETRGPESHLVALPAGEVFCERMTVSPAGIVSREKPPTEHPTDVPIPAYQNGVVPLQSLPGVPAVAYLDFDGEEGPHVLWGDFDADAYPYTNDEIHSIWLRVSEDFAPFTINVTTDLAVFLEAPVNSRQRCIITPTSTAKPGTGGVATYRSFSNSSGISCWVFNQDPKACAETISHEIGHTLSLHHDGNTSPPGEYYFGHGLYPVSWGPIMGGAIVPEVTQWSKGEYRGANQSEDDLAIIVSQNNAIIYRQDDSGSTIATARYLEISGPNNEVSVTGVIETNTDSDAFRFRTSAPGIARLTVKPVLIGSNIDTVVEIINPAGTVLSRVDLPGSLVASVELNLPAGEYAVRVSGTGYGDPLGTGYSSYGSIGSYTIRGTVPNAVQPDRFTVAESSPAGTLAGQVSPRLSHGAHPLAYEVTSGNEAGVFAINSTTGELRVANAALIDFETMTGAWNVPAVFEFFVLLRDLSNPALNELLRVVVTISDINEAGTLSGGSVSIPERLHPGVPVFTLLSTDPDRFDRPSAFEIVSGDPGGFFEISPDGVIRVASPPRITDGTHFELTIAMTDHGSPALTVTSTVVIDLFATPEGYTPGAVRRMIYDGIPGPDLADLTGKRQFPEGPDREVLLFNLADEGRGSNLGSHVRGYLIVPRSGDYTFWIAGNDSCEFRLGTDADPSHATLRATGSSVERHPDWDRSPGQKSTPIPLVAGQVCYLEVLQKQGEGAEYFSVGWSASAGGETVIPREVIPGFQLAGYDGNFAPMVNPSPVVCFENARPGSAIGFASATDYDEGQILSYGITGGSGAPHFRIRPSDGLITVASPSTLSPGGSYTLEITATDNGSPPRSGSFSVPVNLRSAGTFISGLKVLSNPPGAGVTAGPAYFLRGEQAPISVIPSAGETFRRWSGGGVTDPLSPSSSVGFSADPSSLSGAGFTLMSVTDATLPIAPQADSSDLTWSAIGSYQTMDIVDDSGTEGIGSGKALRIEGVTLPANIGYRGLMGTWAAPITLEPGETLTVSLDVRYYEPPPADATGIAIGLVGYLDYTTSVKLGTGGTPGLSLFGGPSGTNYQLSSTVSGPPVESIGTAPVTVVFSVHLPWNGGAMVGAALGNSKIVANWLNYPRFKSLYIQNGKGFADFLIDNVMVSRSPGQAVTAEFLSGDPYAAWVAGYPLSGPAAGKEADPDGDGVPNLAEMHLGFSPVDAASRLTLSITGVQNGSARLVANRLVTAGTFRLDWSDSLAGTWQGSQTVPVAADAWNVEMPVATDVARRFYRLTYLPPP